MVTVVSNYITEQDPKVFSNQNDDEYSRQTQDSLDQCSNSTNKINETKKKALYTKLKAQNSCRTKVSYYHAARQSWEKKFNENKFFKYRVISRRYNRKLSVDTQRQSVELQEVARKVSWDEELQVVYFAKSQKAQAIVKCQRHKDILFSNQVTYIQ